MEKTAASKIPDELVSKITLMAYQMSPHPLATILEKAIFCDEQRTVEYYIEDGWGEEYVFRTASPSQKLIYTYIQKRFEYLPEYLKETG